jgi:hypothetical protein
MTCSCAAGVASAISINASAMIGRRTAAVSGRIVCRGRTNLLWMNFNVPCERAETVGLTVKSVFAMLGQICMEIG